MYNVKNIKDSVREMFVEYKENLDKNDIVDIHINCKEKSKIKIDFI
jgi:hypothetical protein